MRKSRGNSDGKATRKSTTEAPEKWGGDFRPTCEIAQRGAAPESGPPQGGGRRAQTVPRGHPSGGVATSRGPKFGPCASEFLFFAPLGKVSGISASGGEKKEILDI